MWCMYTDYQSYHEQIMNKSSAYFRQPWNINPFMAEAL